MSSIASATREAHRLAVKHLDWVACYDLVRISSNHTADSVTGAPQMRTVISFPASVDASDLACAVERLPGLIRSDWTHYAITIVLRSA